MLQTKVPKTHSLNPFLPFLTPNWKSQHIKKKNQQGKTDEDGQGEKLGKNSKKKTRNTNKKTKREKQQEKKEEEKQKGRKKKQTTTTINKNKKKYEKKVCEDGKKKQSLIQLREPRMGFVGLVYWWMLGPWGQPRVLWVL